MDKHDLQQELRPLTPGGNTDYKHQHGLRQQPIPQTTTCPMAASSVDQENQQSQVAALTTKDINTGLRQKQTTNANMALTGSIGHSHPYGLWQQHSLKASTQPAQAVQTTGTATAAAVAQATYSNMASGGSTDHGGFLRRPSPGNEPISMDILMLQEPVDPGGWGASSGPEPACVPGCCSPP